MGQAFRCTPELPVHRDLLNNDVGQLTGHESYDSTVSNVSRVNQSFCSVDRGSLERRFPNDLLELLRRGHD